MIPLTEIFDRPLLDAAAQDADVGVEIEIDLEDALRLASIQRRRYAIERIATHGRIEVRDIAEFIASREADGSRKVRQSVYSGLIQSHLPRLDSEGIVNYDENWKIVEPGPHFDEFWEFVQDVRERFQTDGGEE